MARSSNALWIGAIVIVAALTAVELTSTRNNDDASGSVENKTAIADTATTASPVQSAGLITSGNITHNTDDDELTADAEIDFDPSVFQAPDLVIDLDNLDTDSAQNNDDILEETEALTRLSEIIDQQESIQEKPVDDLQTASVSEIAETANNEIVTEPSDTETANIPEALTEKAVPEEQEIKHSPGMRTISQHLEKAKLAIKELRLTTPEGDNAHEHYQAVLAIDANQADAKAGIQQIIDMYIYFVEKAITDEKLPTAMVYLKRAESLQPDSEKLRALRAELE